MGISRLLSLSRVILVTQDIYLCKRDKSTHKNWVELSPLHRILTCVRGISQLKKLSRVIPLTQDVTGVRGISRLRKIIESSYPHYTGYNLCKRDKSTHKNWVELSHYTGYLTCVRGISRLKKLSRVIPFTQDITCVRGISRLRKIIESSYPHYTGY